MSELKNILGKLERLEKENEELLNDLKKVPVDLLTYKPDDNSWSLIQVLNHIKGAESGTLSYIRKKLKYGGIKNLNWSAGVRGALMKMVNNSSLRFKMPSALKQPSTEGTLESISQDWKDLRREWEEEIKKYPQSELNKAIFKHPIFGRLSLSQAMDSMISHQNHHRKQVRRIKKSLNLEIND